MEDNLRYWRLRKTLTVREATCLAFGFGPSDPEEGEPLPKGWSGLFSSLVEAIKSDIADYRFWNDKPGKQPCPDLYFYDVSTLSEASTFKVDEFKNWFESNNIRPSFFFPEDNSKLNIDNLFISPPKRKHELFVVVEKLTASYIEEHQVFPDDMDLWEMLKDKYPNEYDQNKQAIQGLSKSQNGLSWPAFRKLFTEWTKKIEG